MTSMPDYIKKIQRVTAKAIIKKDSKILLLEEPDHRWEFPGGKIEFGNAPEETLKRELQEELGLTDLKIGPIFNAWSWVFKFETHLQFFMLAYLCETSQTDFQLSAEHINYGWFTKSDALQLNLTEGTRKTLEKM